MTVAMKIFAAFLAMACISYVGVPSRAEAATAEDMRLLMAAFNQMKFRVVNARHLAFWDALNTQTATCWIMTPPSNLATPPKGSGWYTSQWSLRTTTAIVSEEQCYAAP